VFLHSVSHELLPEFASHGRGSGHEDQAGCGTVKSMDWVEELLQLVSKGLQQDRLVLGTACSSMDHHSGRLKGRNQILIAVDDLDRPMQTFNHKIRGVFHGRRPKTAATKSTPFFIERLAKPG
jgi:hypothetical protein